jgi:hypothetical protein
MADGHRTVLLEPSNNTSPRSRGRQLRTRGKLVSVNPGHAFSLPWRSRTYAAAWAAWLIGCTLITRAAAAPPWPYRPWPEQDTLAARLDTIELTWEAVNEPIARWLADVSTRAGIPCRIDSTIVASHPINLPRMYSKLSEALDVLCRGRGWQWLPRVDDVIVTAEPQRYEFGNGSRVRTALVQARMFPRLLAEAEEQLRRDTVLTRRLEETIELVAPLRTRQRHAIAALRGILDLELEAEAPSEAERELQLAAGRYTRRELLDLACDELGWQHTVHRGKVILGPPAAAAIVRKLARQSRELVSSYQTWSAALDELPLTLANAEYTLRDVARHVARQLQRPLHLDEGPWDDERPVTIQDIATFRALRTTLTRQLGNSLRFITLDGEAVYVIFTP